MAKKDKNRTLVQLAQELREKHAVLNSWPKASVDCCVLTSDGRPNPSLAQRIATEGYEPKRSETRTRLGMAPVCFTCGQKVKYVRHIPTWLEEAVKNLQLKEAAANVPLEEKRVYARGGKRVIGARPFTSF